MAFHRKVRVFVSLCVSVCLCEPGVSPKGLSVYEWLIRAKMKVPTGNE